MFCCGVSEIKVIRRRHSAGHDLGSHCRCKVLLYISDFTSLFAGIWSKTATMSANNDHSDRTFFQECADDFLCCDRFLLRLYAHYAFS